MSRIELKEAQEHLPELVEQAAGGEEVVITRDDRPLARLVAVQQKRQRQFGSARGLIKIADDVEEPLEDFRDYT